MIMKWWNINDENDGVMIVMKIMINNENNVIM